MRELAWARTSASAAWYWVASASADALTDSASSSWPRMCA